MAFISQHWIDATASGDPNTESLDPATDEVVGHFALRNGTVWIDKHNKLFAEAETDGHRQIGIGRLHGCDALADFTEHKHIYQAPGVV